MRFTRYSHRASNLSSPSRTFRRSSPIRTPEKTSARSTGVVTSKQGRDEHARDGPGSDPLQDVWTGTVQDTHGKLPAVRACVTSALRVHDSPARAGGGSGG